MSSDFRIDDKESLYYSDFLSQSFFSNKVKTYFYGFFGNLFKIKYHKKTKQKVQMLNEILINTIMTLQLTSLAWYPNLDAEMWDSCKIFWSRLGIVSYDEVCAAWNIMGFCFYGTVALLAICLGSFWVFGTYIYLKKEPPTFLASFPQKIAFFLTSVCLIPSTMISLMVFKYSLWPKETVKEYDGISSGETINFGMPGVVFSIMSIGLLVLVSVFSELFTCDIKHSHSQKNLKARSSASLDFHRRWFYIFMCSAYMGFGDTNVIIHQIISAAWSIYLLIKSFIVLQYYNVFENSVQACEQASISVTLLIFIFGQIMDNAVIIVILSIFLQPIVFIFTILLVKKYYCNLPNRTSRINNQFDFERKFRNFLIDENKENKDKVLNLFKEYWNSSFFYKEKLFVMWEFNYCLYLKDERLARIKLSKISAVKSSFEGDIQKWRIFTWLENKKRKPFPDINYLQYLKELSRVKKIDEELCLILIELHNEFLARSPRIDKLIKLVIRTSITAKQTAESYKSLTEKHKNFESYDLYASFLDNIAGNHDEANLINRKKNNISHYYNQKNDERLEKYGKGVGVILISCANNNFGSIVYLNEKAATNLKSSVSNIYGASILNFIPAPYDISHEKIMKKFIYDCTSTHICSHQDLMFQCTDGFFLECDTLIKLTAFHNSAYYLLSFKPKKTSRDIALISDEGFIISHSISFPYCFSNEKCLNNWSISKIFPNFGNLKKDVPWILTHNGKEIGIVNVKKEIKSKTMNLLVIIHDAEELAKWKLNENEEFNSETIDDRLNLEENDISIFKEIKQSNEKKLQDFPDQLFERKMVRLRTILPQKLGSTNAIGIDESKKFEMAPSDEPSRRSSIIANQLHTKFSKLLLVESKQKIRILQLVLFIAMSSTLACVIGILAYMITDISHTTAMSSFNRQGKLLFNLVYMADLARTLDKGKLLGSPKYLEDHYGYLLGNLSLELENLQGYLLDDFRQWDYCPYAKVISKPIIPQWNFDGAYPEIIFENFYDTVTDFIYSGTNLIDDIRNNRSYSNHVKFIMANGLGYTFNYVNRTMSEIVNCEVDRVKETGEKIGALLMFGFCTVGVLVFIVGGFIFLVSKKHDEFWNFVLEKAQSSLVQLKASSIDRLLMVHGLDFQSETNAQLKNSRKKIQSNLYKSYIWRVAIFFTIVASYYLLIYFYLYPSCEKNMINRPKFLSNFNIRRSLLSRLTVWAREINVPYLIKLLPYPYLFPNPSSLLLSTLDELNKKSKEIVESDFVALMSEELRERVFEKGNSTINRLYSGTQPAVTIIKDDIYNILSWNIQYYLAEIVSLLNKVAEIENEIGNEFELADRDSKNIINWQLNAIILTTAIYSFAVVLLYFFYYLPYLKKQIKQLEMYEILPTILTMESS
ncbi:unnamed protein product [Blepharisma stoltei]|uniref:TmcB/TmcC TPR repeats domain-containing protein n=1 Tax=Blepharisma stoltei TaxID=1481888 RepID=A0AAU9IQM7_9CILI|nr:unnamed protein product [Blepharisma stoltei]